MTENRETGYHESVEALIAEVRGAAISWHRRADDGFEKSNMRGPGEIDQGEFNDYAGSLMAHAYSFVLANVVQMVDDYDADLGHQIACYVDDALTNGGDGQYAKEWTEAEAAYDAAVGAMTDG